MTDPKRVDWQLRLYRSTAFQMAVPVLCVLWIALTIYNACCRND